MVEHLRTRFSARADTRAEEQLRYSLPDTLMSGVALMFFQRPSLLQFQRAMEKKRQRCNLQTIFGVQAIPSDTQMREILDGVEPEALRGLLPQLWEKMRRAGWGGQFTTTRPSGQHQGAYYTVALDGSEYFRSTRVQCTHCLRQPDSKGRVRYSHLIVGATLVRAGSHQVVPIDVEEVRNATAESAPQDCELTASKRLLARLRREHPQMAQIVTGDGLYSHVPFVEQLHQHRQHCVSGQTDLTSDIDGSGHCSRRSGAESDRSVDPRQRDTAADLYLSSRVPGAFSVGESRTRELLGGLGTERRRGTPLSQQLDYGS